MSFYAIVDFMYKNSLKILLTLVLGEKNGFNFTKKSFLALIEWFCLTCDHSLQVEDNTNRLLSLTQR